MRPRGGEYGRRRWVIRQPAVLDEDAGAAVAGPVAGSWDARDWLNGSPVNLALAVGVTVVVALAGLTGWLGFRAYQATQAEHLQQLLVAAGRQGAVNLTTIDYERADADVQRILDSATGDFTMTSRQARQVFPFADFVKQTQAKSVGTVSEAGLGIGRRGRGTSADCDDHQEFKPRRGSAAESLALEGHREKSGETKRRFREWSRSSEFANDPIAGQRHPSRDRPAARRRRRIPQMGGFVSPRRSACPNRICQRCIGNPPSPC